jgi:hypothetical protein
MHIKAVAFGRGTVGLYTCYVKEHWSKTKMTDYRDELFEAFVQAALDYCEAASWPIIALELRDSQEALFRAYTAYDEALERQSD